MFMAIIISEQGKNAKRVEESKFGLEDKLQQYIYDNPDVIPLYDIDVDTRLFIAAREFSTKSGPIDALGFDTSGNIYVVETKLYKNPDKRMVVAQALDYGASLWRHSIDFEYFTSQIDEHCQKQFNSTFKEKYSEFFELDDVSENFATIRSNLAEGSIKFVVLMDKLYEPLKDLVIFVNQNSKFDLYAVELEYYMHKSFEIIIPKLYGAEVKKDVTSSSGKAIKPKWEQTDEEEFISNLDQSYERDEISEVAYLGVKELVKLYNNISSFTEGSSSYWRVEYQSKNLVKYFLNDPDNKTTLCIQSDGGFAAYKYSKVGPQIDFLNNTLEELIRRKIFKKTTKNREGNQWFLALTKSNTKDNDIRQFIESNKKAYTMLKHNTASS